MDVTLERLMTQKRELEQYADRLTDIRSGLVRHKSRLNDVWVSGEMELLNDEMDSLGRQAKRIIDELNGIAYDLIKAYEGLAGEETGD